MYKQLKKILDSQGNVNRELTRALTGTSQPALTSPVSQSSNVLSTSQTNVPHQSATSELKSNSIPYKLEKTHRKKTHNKKTHNKKHSEKDYGSHKLDSLPSKPKVIANAKDSDSSIPAIAFGKAEWKKYFGYIGAEPPLPSNIEEILNEPCSFWPNKKVKETHILVLIPNKVNGQPFTLDYLGELIQRPKSGHPTQYRYYDDKVKKALGQKSYPSHWTLMTKNVVPGTDKGTSRACDVIASYVNKTGVPYNIPHELDAATSILMHYVKTGERLYNDDPWTFMYGVDEDGSYLVIGGFTPSGLSIYLKGFYYHHSMAVTRILS